MKINVQVSHLDDPPTAAYESAEPQARKQAPRRPGKLPEPPDFSFTSC